MRKDDPLYRKPKNAIITTTIILGIVLVNGFLGYQTPWAQEHLGWRIDILQTKIRRIIHSLPAQPTVSAEANLAADLSTATLAPTVTPTMIPITLSFTATPLPPTPTASPSPTTLPETVLLTPPPYESQDWNNCGPAALSMYLNYYGWEGSQTTISNVVKPFRNDRNVNIDELLSFAQSEVNWLDSLYRVNGDVDLLRQIIASGIPVVIETTFHFDEAFWTDDDLWGGHYLRITGYDDQKQVFITQNTFQGANMEVPYTQLDQDWQAFNRVYLLVYPPEASETVNAILGTNVDIDQNRQAALDTARAETISDPNNVFAWFNLGTNLTYFDDYQGAVEAYDRARQIGLPQRMLRYQFGPFLAYFQYGRIDDLTALSQYALEITPNSEEALLWNGWALYRSGKPDEAQKQFKSALEYHPGYTDAQYALDYLANN